MTQFSIPGEKLSQHSGIMQLMDDLGQAMTLNPDAKMLGGGNPAAIPAVQQIWRDQILAMVDNGQIDRVLANYDPPRGSPGFLKNLASFLNKECNWSVDEENLAITPGGQVAFFLLFNLLAGDMPDGSRRKILLPIAPEYIGYCDQGFSDDMFMACRPQIELEGSHEFKYHVDFDAVARKLKQSIGGICISRPTNPSGNVLTTDEIQRLQAIAHECDCPFILDNAYGQPFPGVVFNDSVVSWNEDLIFTLSLSKLGLPGTRTGIVVAKPEIAYAVSKAMAIVGLANSNIGQAIVSPLLMSGELSNVCTSMIRPFYQEKSEFARHAITETFQDRFEYRVHKSEGAFFLWIWFPSLKCTTKELYVRLKSRNVIVVPGEYFFFGLDGPWEHAHQCIRLSFAMNNEIVAAGIREIADEVEDVQSGH